MIRRLLEEKPAPLAFPTLRVLISSGSALLGGSRTWSRPGTTKVRTSTSWRAPL